MSRTKTKATESPSLTPDERVILDRVETQETDWHTIREDELTDYSLSQDMLELPPEAIKMQRDKVYAFRWVERKPERIDMVTKSAPIQRRWTMVTRTTMPALEHYIDGSLGCVCRLDQCLVFRPWAFHQKEQDFKMGQAEARYKAGSLEGRKQAILSRDDDVKVTTGEAAKISKSDIVVYDEAAGDGLGDLVAED